MLSKKRFEEIEKEEEGKKGMTSKNGYDYFFDGGAYSESNITLKSTNIDDFEKLKEDLKLGETLNLRSMDVTKENIEKIAEVSKMFSTNKNGRAPLDSFELPFLDEEKSNFQIFGGGGVEKTTLKSLDMGGLTLDDNKFEIKMKLEHYSYDPVTNEKNDYVKDTIKDIAKKNNSKLEFEHNLGSEEFYHRMGKTTSVIYNEKENFDIQGNSKYYSLEYYPDNSGKSIKEEKVFGRDVETTQDKSTIKNIVEKIKAPFKAKEKQQSKTQDVER